jgi:flagellar biosynthesis/type III secretory pathway protein FliH
VRLCLKKKRIKKRSQAWWCTSVIPAPGRLWQEDCKFEDSLSYIARPCLTERRKERNERGRERKKGREEGRKKGREEGGRTGRKGGRKEGRKGGRKEGGKEGKQIRSPAKVSLLASECSVD